LNKLNIAFQHLQRREFQQAELLCQQILTESPTQPETIHLLGMLAYQRGHLPKAEQLFRHSIALKPTDFFYNNLGTLYHDQGQFELAESCFQQALSFNPHHPEILYHLAIVLKNQGKFKPALECLQHLLQIKPDWVEAYNQLGEVYYAQNQLTAALTYWQTALQLQANHVPTHFNYAKLLLKSGRFIEGWEELHQWHFEMTKQNYSHLKQPSWDGTPLAGRRLLVHWELGLGDTIQFARYLPLIEGRVIFVCPTTLAPLFHQSLPPHILVVTSLDNIDFDVWTTPLSLPYFFATTLASIPASIPYVHPHRAKVEKWQHQYFARDYLNVGIVWASHPGHRQSYQRTCTLDEFRPLTKLPKLTLFSLQMGEAIPKGFPLISLTEEIQDFSDTAAIIAGLDLVICVDTAVAHLAGALGKPVWVLLPYAADWRWLENRNDSPWYPTMRLFRQSQPNDWQGVFREVASVLNQHLMDNKITFLLQANVSNNSI